MEQSAAYGCKKLDQNLANLIELPVLKYYETDFLLNTLKSVGICVQSVLTLAYFEIVKIK